MSLCLLQCGWCGAINEPKLPQSLKSSPHRLLLAVFGRVSYVLRWVIVVFILAIILGVIAAGIGLILPRYFESPAVLAAHRGFGLILAFNVLFNYAAATARSAGSVRECIQLPQRMNGYFAQHSFDGYVLCRPCQAPKPPGVHHCRACKACVVEMDHHCPFINNCIGRGNLGAFLLFLVYLIVSTIYIMVICALLIHTNIPLIKQTVVKAQVQAVGSARAHQLGLLGPAAAAGAAAASSPLANQSSSTSSTGGYGGPPITILAGSSNGSSSTSAVQPGIVSLAPSGNATGAAAVAAGLGSVVPPGKFAFIARACLGMFAIVADSPWWLIVTYYLFAVALSVCLAVSVLLGSQLRYLAIGVTYIDYIKAGHQGFHAPQPSRKMLWERLQQVFGAGHWCTWLLPRWRPVPGTLLSSCSRPKVL